MCAYPSSGLRLWIIGSTLRRLSTEKANGEAASKAAKCVAKKVVERGGDTRPSIAPKPSIDIKPILKDPELYKRNCFNRNYKWAAYNPHRIKELSKMLHQLEEKAKPLRKQKNSLEQTLKVPKTPIEEPIAGGEKHVPEPEPWRPNSRETKLASLALLKLQLLDIQNEANPLQAELENLSEELPNLASPEAPIGNTPKVVGYINHEREPLHSHLSKSHVEIGKELQLLDFEAASTTTGWGWYFLMNEAALLEQALIQYALSVAVKKGWMLVSPPSIVYSHMATACGFKPRDQNDEQQIYTLEQKDDLKPELSLAGTAEIPIAAMNAKKILDHQQMPLKVVGVSRCYRAEAGSRGVDTKGLYRVHEFTKVEMFAWTLPSAAPGDRPCPVQTMFDEMVSIQMEVLRNLNLHCRILEMPTSDLGASAARKQDIEAFFPSRRQKDNGWGEVTSASICTDYQTRRLMTRVRLADPSRIVYPHTVNGTALAVPRVVMALLENGWDNDKKVVVIPKVLRPWMGGIEAIKKRDAP
ncbi:hypothetical protein FGG08_002819 [Glutinoglossum americanum]|uniref:serine--tRNA ligase n=1 Tax=Glutinoglossum americanum TaxID=1670608 RepID=A0A9P8HZF6_9PEZI|nr:hypothetical protein FGG08_002819 [Glutinoglossum americanum]